nr:Gag-Pol polyprotein [Tanacetum cinerariifolium]
MMKKIQKQLKKANATLTHELNECKSALEESNDIRGKPRNALHDQEIELEKNKKFKIVKLKKKRLSHLNFDTINLLSKKDIVNDVPKLKYVKDQLRSSCEWGQAKRNTTDPSPQELELLFSPMYEEYFTAGNQSMSKSSTLFDNFQKQDTQTTLNVQPTLEPTTLSNVNAEETNTDQAADA